MTDIPYKTQTEQVAIIEELSEKALSMAVIRQPLLLTTLVTLAVIVIFSQNTGYNNTTAIHH